MEITAGFTRTTANAEYIPAADGYRRGAAQILRTQTIPGTVPPLLAVEWCEGVYLATNRPQAFPYAGMGGRGVAAATLIRRWAAQGTGRGTRPGWRALHRGDTVIVFGEIWECLSTDEFGAADEECPPAGFARIGYAWPRLTLEQAVDLHVRLLAAAVEVGACGAPAAARALREAIQMHGPRPTPIPNLDLPYCPVCLEAVVAGEEPIPAAAPCATVRVLADQLMVSPLPRREGARP